MSLNSTVRQKNWEDRGEEGRGEKRSARWPSAFAAMGNKERSCEGGKGTDSTVAGAMPVGCAIRPKSFASGGIACGCWAGRQALWVGKMRV